MTAPGTQWPFLVNPLGTQLDMVLENNSNYYPEWDAIWDVEAMRTDDGWTAEMAIPFRSISYDPGADKWGFEIIRQIRHKSETVRVVPDRSIPQSHTMFQE